MIRTIGAALLLAGCGGEARTSANPDGGRGCSDPDGDGFGVGADCAGPDCDENNPRLHECADCEADPAGVGCPCVDRGTPEACYEGPDATSVNLPCRPGTRSCRGGAWSGCEGQRLPEPERCDEVDDDCDGAVDEGVQNACGTCDEICEEMRLGVGGEPWDVAREGGAGVVGSEGALTLDRSALLLPYIWIPNEADDTVSKVNTRTRVEEGRYVIAPIIPISTADIQGISTNQDADVVLGLHVNGEEGARLTRVDLDCPAGDTSTGPDDVLPWGEDACVVWSTELPTEGPYWSGTVVWEARVGLDGLEEYIWVADGRGYEILEVSADGEPTGRSVDIVDGSPYGITIDANGLLWVQAVGGIADFLVNIDPVALDVVDSYEEPTRGSFCLAASKDGTIWISGWQHPSSTCGFEVGPEDFTCFGLDTEHVSVGDDEAWFGSKAEGVVYRVSLDGSDPERIALFDSGGPATGVAADGWIWAVPGGLSPFGLSSALTFPPDDPASVESAVDTLANPGTACGDMTGTQLLYATEIAGTYEHLFEGCDRGRSTSWHGLEWSAFTSGDARVRFEARVADTLALLDVAEWLLVGEAPASAPPLDVASALSRAGVEQASLLDLRITLLANGDDFPPRLDWVSIQRACGEGPQ